VDPQCHRKCPYEREAEGCLTQRSKQHEDGAEKDLKTLALKSKQMRSQVKEH
jgi:hypothetical protein